MRSIKTKMIIKLGVLILAICIGFGVASYFTSKNALKSSVNKTLPQIAIETANVIEAKINANLLVLEDISCREEIIDPNNPYEKKLELLRSEVKRLGALKMGISDLNGDILYTDGKEINIADRQYFQKAKAGMGNVSDPLISKTDGSVVTVYAVPIKSGDSIIGILVCTQDNNALSKFSNNVKIGESGNAFMINKSGIVVAHNNEELVKTMYNPIEEAKKDTKLEGIGNIVNKMTEGNAGSGYYYFEGVNKYVGYAPVNNSDWSIAVVINENEILSELATMKKLMIAISALFLLVGVVAIYIVSSKIAGSIKRTSKHLDTLAKGDFTFEINSKYINSKDEIGLMARSIKEMKSSLSSMILSIRESSNSIMNQSHNLSSVSEEMSSSSQNIASAINDMAEGAGSQSEELLQSTQMLDKFSENLSLMVNEIGEIDKNSQDINSQAKESSKNMQQMTTSINSIDGSFNIFSEKILKLMDSIKQINDITNVINGIADQTNLLALNAAIEASRAGEAGKGFSVVADEIRMLAEQSKRSSESINKLISEIEKDTNLIVENTKEMSGELNSQVRTIVYSTESYKNIIEAINNIIPKIKYINSTAINLDTSKNDILDKLNGVSAIAEEASASSEEISASSEELTASSQEVASASQMLSTMTKEMSEQVNKFIV